MLRQFSGANNRYRGLNPKDALHISLILAVTVWILYHLTFSYQNNLIVEYMQVKVHQEYKIEQGFGRNPTTGSTDTAKVTQFEKDRGNTEKVVNKDHIEKGGDIEQRMKEHEAREKSFKDDDASSAVLHNNDMPQIIEESESEIATNSRNQNTMNDDKEFDFILGNGTINETALEKKNISHMGNFSEKSDGIKGTKKIDNVLFINLNVTTT